MDRCITAGEGSEGYGKRTGGKITPWDQRVGRGDDAIWRQEAWGDIQ